VHPRHVVVERFCDCRVPAIGDAMRDDGELTTAIDAPG